MLWFCCWIIALATYDRGPEEATDWMRPPLWSGNFWGPAASRARLAGQLPPLPTNPAMDRWRRWGRGVLHEGDVVFRLGDARTMHGFFPLSHFIAHASRSPFSHTAIVAIEDESPVVYDCSSVGVRRQPFEVWMLESHASLGVKRLKPEHRQHIPGVIGYCRKIFEQQVPFDYEFRLDDAAFYCLELTEKAFRSQGLALSEPVKIGDWENLVSYPLTAFAIPHATKQALGRPITLEQPVYLPGNERQGTWASPLLVTVVGPESKGARDPAPEQPGSLNFRGDYELAVFIASELYRSYSEFPVRLICDLDLVMRVPLLYAVGTPDARRASVSNEVRSFAAKSSRGPLRPVPTTGLQF